MVHAIHDLDDALRKHSRDITFEVSWVDAMAEVGDSRVIEHTSHFSGLQEVSVIVTVDRDPCEDAHNAEDEYEALEPLEEQIDPGAVLYEPLVGSAEGDVREAPALRVVVGPAAQVVGHLADIERREAPSQLLLWGQSR